MKVYKDWFLVVFLICYQFICAQNSESSISVFNADGTIAYGASILIDSEGFVWNTTQESLIKRIGNKSIYFPYDHPKYEKLGIVRLKEAKNGKIIGFSKFGCFVFDKQKETLNWKYFYDDYFVNPIKDELGNIWSITMKGDLSFCYTHEGDFLQFDHSRFLQQSNLKELNLRLLYALEDGTLAAKSMYDVWYKIKGDTVTILKSLTTKTKGGKWSTFLVKNNTVFKENTSGFFTYKGQKYPYQYLSEINRHLLYLPYDSAAYLHYIYHKQYHTVNNNDTDLVLVSNKIVELIQVLPNNQFKVKEAINMASLINNFTLQEQEDRLWVSHNGILEAIPIQNHVQKYFFYDHSGNQLSDINARSITKTKNGDIYFLQNNAGIFKLKEHTNTFQEIQFTSGKIRSSLVGLYGFYTLNDSILIGYGWRPEILKIDIKNHTFHEIKAPTKDVNYAINDVQLLDQNTLLLFGGSSILALDLKNYRIKNLPNLEAFLKPDQNIHTAYLDTKKNVLWLGMHRDGGLYRMNMTTYEVQHFHTESIKMPLIHNNINVMYPDGDDILWIGTQKGLQKIDTKKQIVLETYTRSTGLKNDHIVSITSNDTYLWFGTFNGLVALHKKEGTFQTFSQDDSFPDFEYNRKSILNISEDSLFFGGMKSIIKINPKESLFSRKRNKLFLTKINYYDNALEEDITTQLNLDALKVINVPYRENYLFLSFSINEIFDNDKVSYRYKILGINDQWVEIGNTGELFLQGIKSGDYKLQIQGFNASNEPTNILEYDLCIDRPFYMKLWFYALCALFLISGFTTYIFYQKNEFSKAQAMHELEAKSSQAQMLPHFTFNTINCIQSVMLTQGEKEANKVIVAYSKLLRHTLDVFHTDLISLKDEISYIRAYLSVEKLRAHFSFSVAVDPDIDTRHWLIPSMMFQPLIENAIKHGIIPKKEAGTLQVSFHITQEVLVGEVIDNGIGRQASQELKNQKKETHTSWATKILEERIYLFNKVYAKKIHFEIQDLNSESYETGTKAILRIPLLTR